MAQILSTGFERGLATGGLGFDGVDTSSAIARSASFARHGTYSAAVTGGVYSTGARLWKTISNEVVTFSFYFALPAIPAADAVLVTGFGTTGASSDPQISVRSTGKLIARVNSLNGTESTLVLSTGTIYLCDGRFDCSSSTYTVDYRISDTNGSVLFTASQLAQGGLVASPMTEFRVGQVGATVSMGCYIDDVRATDQSADYPLGPGTGDDTPPTGMTTFPVNWIDHPYTQISGGILTGFHCEYASVGAPTTPPVLLSEGVTKGNRTNNVAHTFYQRMIAPPLNLYVETVMLNAYLLGHQCWPIINPLGFASGTTDWPAGGLADFTNGSQDTNLQGWCDLLNALPATPVLLRIFREMNTNNTIYGPNGAARGGVNETPSTFIAAWRYVVGFIRARCPYARFVWCPATGSVANASNPTWFTNYDPGDAYVDWRGIDGYVHLEGPSYSLINTVFTTFHGLYNRSTGSASRARPIMVCESQVAKADPNRVTDIHTYTSAFTTLFPGFKALCFWDDDGTGVNTITDSPAGYLSAFQGVARSAPFLGKAHVTRPSRRRRSTFKGAA